MYYLSAKHTKLQNLTVILASIFFYAYGHIHYFFIWAGISVFTYFSALLIQRFAAYRLQLSIAGIASIVAFFMAIKYTTMFGELMHINIPTSLTDLQMLLPIGLSFYSFTCIAYLADVYNKRVQACSNPLQYFAYSSFFHQILSGPISFADIQLPQFEKSRTFSVENFKSAMPFIVWGLFKKVVIANTLIKPIAYIFSHSDQHHAYTLIIGLLIYSIQVYADFSGYSDMAYGIARMLGIEIPLNFRMPYFSNNIAEYWRRWHSSLSKWLGRYIYIPLGGKKGSFLIHVRNISIVFAISGLWHGASMKFVAWGLINGFFYILFLVQEKQLFAKPILSPSVTMNKFLVPSGMILTFLSVTIVRVYFRSETFAQGNEYLWNMMHHTGNGYTFFGFKYLLICIAFIGFEWFRRKQVSPLQMPTTHKFLQLGAYAVTIAFILFALQQPQSTEHIYFKY
jgi:D-alanyl-lipoteichoic acid acyltransferase DltB (MBOAT superfamily)